MNYSSDCNFTPDKDSEIITCVVEQGADDLTCMKCDLHKLGRRIYEESQGSQQEDGSAESFLDDPETAESEEES
jgi:hypothetical protein